MLIKMERVRQMFQLGTPEAPVERTNYLTPELAEEGFRLRRKRYLFSLYLNRKNHQVQPWAEVEAFLFSYGRKGDG